MGETAGARRAHGTTRSGGFLRHPFSSSFNVPEERALYERYATIYSTGRVWWRQTRMRQPLRSSTINARDEPFGNGPCRHLMPFRSLFSEPRQCMLLESYMCILLSSTFVAYSLRLFRSVSVSVSFSLCWRVSCESVLSWPMIRTLVQKTTTKRCRISQTVRDLVAARQNQQCAHWQKVHPPPSLSAFRPPVCSRLLPVPFDLDHVIALADGGTNDMNNLQALCQNCHAAKTRDERIRRQAAKSGVAAGTSPYWQPGSTVALGSPAPPNPSVANFMKRKKKMN